MEKTVGARRGRVRSETSRTAILDATRDLTNEAGFAHVTIEKIAARAHVGKPTIYRWWQSKNAILAECVVRGEMLPTAEYVTPTDGSHIDVVGVFRIALDYVDANKPLLSGLAAAAFEDPVIAEQMNTHLMRPFELLLHERAGAAGPGPLAPGEISVASLTQLMLGMILLRLGPGATNDDFSADAVFEALMSHVKVDPKDSR
ncbi:hypothetical protein AX769_16825 [Frondihabitans sp. PAMC 28766]|uniref:TetR/AcrR family transcriptional regulator n=1 Tax=Frondihabitans sp. PAMC 28766 TaxID=1795630 RepID=UPI00078E4C9C|nr:TetR/AcrR family transcriptional regulator [Frondihabitans sp. PAMC 28766]AMM21496.1 hypothetical protein AX769_16825 [Frondihabitans sp. PAMC 28766]